MLKCIMVTARSLVASLDNVLSSNQGIAAKAFRKIYFPLNASRPLLILFLILPAHANIIARPSGGDADSVHSTNLHLCERGSPLCALAVVHTCS